jgi:glycosyltransferase involved in cell wall biosynthesis
MRVFFFEPDNRGFRKSFLDGFQKNSRHEIVSFTLPEGQRAPGSSKGLLLPFLDKISRQQQSTRPAANGSSEGFADKVDALLTTDPQNLCDLYGLGRQWLAGIPSAIVFHEQGFQRGPMRRQSDVQQGFSLMNSFLAADRLFFYSEHHRESCMEQMLPLIRQLPEFPGKRRVMDAVRHKTRLVRPGVSLRELDQWRHDLKYNSPTILWNLRWEASKRPAVFFDTIYRLAEEGLDFGVVICGQKPDPRVESLQQESTFSVFEEARHRLGDRLFHFGYVNSRAEYANLLWMSDIVVSTAETHFFPAGIIEAAFCDCYPLLPNRLDYPTLLPASQHDRFLYSDDHDLYARLKNLLLDPLEIHSAHLRHNMLAFEWEKRTRSLDDEIAQLRATYQTEVVSPIQPPPQWK